MKCIDMTDIMYSHVYVTCRNHGAHCLLNDVIGIQPNLARIENNDGKHLKIRICGNDVEREKCSEDLLNIAECVCSQCLLNNHGHKRR